MLKEALLMVHSEDMLLPFSLESREKIYDLLISNLLSTIDVLLGNWVICPTSPNKSIIQS